MAAGNVHRVRQDVLVAIRAHAPFARGFATVADSGDRRILETPTGDRGRKKRERQKPSPNVALTRSGCDPPETQVHSRGQDSNPATTARELRLVPALGTRDQPAP
jgi:hypothetical protein